MKIKLNNKIFDMSEMDLIELDHVYTPDPTMDTPRPKTIEVVTFRYKNGEVHRLNVEMSEKFRWFLNIHGGVFLVDIDKLYGASTSGVTQERTYSIPPWAKAEP